MRRSALGPKRPLDIGRVLAKSGCRNGTYCLIENLHGFDASVPHIDAGMSEHYGFLRTLFRNVKLEDNAISIPASAEGNVY